MDEITKFTGAYGLTIGIIIWTIFGVLKIAEKVAPDVWTFYKKDAEGKREQEKKIKEEELRQESLQLLIAQGSRTFTEEQLTMMTSETQTQLSEANEYIRRDMAEKLDAIIQQLIVIKDRIDRIPTIIGEKYKTEFEENQRLRANIRMIAYILEKEFANKYVIIDDERSESSSQPKAIDK